MLAPPVAGLSGRLQHGHGRDAGAAAFSHERRERRQGREVPNLIEREQQRRIKLAPGERAASLRAVSMRSSTNAATNDAEAPAPAPVASR